MLRLEFGNHRLRASAWMTALTLAAVVLFTGLGRWQWHRAEEKRALVAAFAAGTADVASPLGARTTASLARYTRVLARGQYDGARQFLLDNMIRGGRAGYEVLTPFRLDDGRLLLVNRGWVSLPRGRRDILPNVALPVPAAGPAPGPGHAPAAAFATIAITGRLDDLPVTGMRAGAAPPSLAAQWPKRTSFPDAAELGAALGERVEARQLLLAPEEPNGYFREWHGAGSGFGPERHVSYAVQWWAFAALSLFLYLFMNIERRSP